MKNQLKQPIYTVTGEKVGEVALAEVFSRPLNRTFLSQVMVLLQKNARRPISHTKGRSEVRGGGRKPWRQKGTGRARHGSIRSPIWKGGGVTHGPTRAKVFQVKINKKVRQGALAMAISEKVRQEQFIIVENFGESNPKTKDFVAKVRQILKGFRPKRLLVVTAERDEALERASQNVTGSTIKTARTVNVADMLLAERVIVAKDALQFLTQRLQ